MDELWINGDFSIFSLFFLLCWLQYLGKNLHGCLVLVSKCMFFDVFSILEKYICIFFFFYCSFEQWKELEVEVLGREKFVTAEIYELSFHISLRYNG